MSIDSLLIQLQQKKSWKSVLKTNCRRNGVDASVANHFTIIKMKKFYERMQSLYILTNQQSQNDKNKIKTSVWMQNQLKAFQWTLIVLSSCRGILVQNFSNEEWNELSLIFHKQQCVLEYEARKMIFQRNSKKQKRPWQEEQIKILRQIVNNDNYKNKWNQIARKLYELSQKRYFRSGKQCRERWYNHLDPQKIHGNWQNMHDQTIADFIINRGRKWSQIAKIFKNQRTQHMIKNRYKTILIKMKKLYPHIKKQNQLLKLVLTQPPQQYNQQQDSDQQLFDKIDNQQDQYNQKQQQNIQIQQQQKFHQEQQDKMPIKDMDLQAGTPGQVIFQAFTPNFLNTPHSLIFNYSFGQFEKNQNFFLGQKEQIK